MDILVTFETKHGWTVLDNVLSAPAVNALAQEWARKRLCFICGFTSRESIQILKKSLSIITTSTNWFLNSVFLQQFFDQDYLKLIVCWGWMERKILGCFELPTASIQVTSTPLNFCVWLNVDVAFTWYAVVENIWDFFQRSSFEVTSVTDFCCRNC